MEVNRNYFSAGMDGIRKGFTNDIPSIHTTFVVFSDEFSEVNPSHLASLTFAIVVG